MRVLSVALTAMLCCLSALACERTVGQTAEAFYRWNLQHAGAGLMADADMAPVRPLLSAGLYEKLQAAKAKQDECLAAGSGDEKPPLLEGDLFVNSLEGATRLDGLKESVDGDKAAVAVGLSHVDGRFPAGHRFHTVSWTDTMQLERLRGEWRIADFRFGDGRTLVAVLDDYIKVDCTP